MKGIVTIVRPDWTKQIATTSSCAEQTICGTFWTFYSCYSNCSNQARELSALSEDSQSRRVCPTSASIATASTSISNPPFLNPSLIDLGASDYMTSNCHSFSTLFSKPLKICLAGGSFASAIKKGDLVFLFELILKNVLLVPSFPANLLFVYWLSS